MFSTGSKWLKLISVLICLIVFNQVLLTIFQMNHIFLQLSYVMINICTVFVLIGLLIILRKTRKELNKSNQKLNNIFNSLDVALWSHDLKSDHLFINPGIEKLYGYQLKEFYQDYDLWKKVIHPDDLDVLTERAKLIKQGQPVTSNYRIMRPDGDVRWIQDTGIPTYDDRGNLIDFSGVLFDLTEQKEGEARYRGIVELSPDFIAVIRDWKFDFINDAGSKLIGVESPSDLVGKSILGYVSTSDVRRIRDILHEMDDKELEKNRFELQIVHVDGRKLDVEMSVMKLLYEGKVARLAVGRDITERKKADEIIHQMAYYDALTGLPNRNMFKKHLNNRLLNNTGENLAVLFLDLDRFKVINDTKGHSTGDLVLQIVAKQLTEAVQNAGLVSRQGGDEFLILLDDTTNEKVETISQRIITAFSQPIYIEDDEFFVTPSIGISLFPEDGQDQEMLIKNADTAMYLAKDRGKNNYQYYNPSLNKLSTRKMKLEVALRKAIEKDELTICYQPQIELSTRKIVAVEALLRWNHPKYGGISPVEFIPIAEETGLIVPIGRWVLQKVSEQHKQWKEAGLTSLRVAVNVSVRQIQENDFADDVKRTIQEYKLNPLDLELEITESIMQNIENSTIVLNELKNLGVTISIDDFGKGYSSLSYLKHLPIDKIKIDKSFVDDISHSSNNGSIAKAIIDMGHNMNFTIVAEGIEEVQQVEFLMKNFCEYGQGYYFSKPVSADEVLSIVEKEIE
ncbi:GGDEF and EAL domain-containing protein [Metabacillus litoralis]|uniref:bifunctional diguanylate cyclase/phosphodiesterase n=1 Tax=Metabacillus litoralis TaxID=152268 RepID=UPI001CFC6263|nr:GGDEF and EAL domain-containing protein [Metabacillus litoralis]